MAKEKGKKGLFLKLLVAVVLIAGVAVVVVGSQGEWFQGMLRGVSLPQTADKLDAEDLTVAAQHITCEEKPSVYDYIEVGTLRYSLKGATFRNIASTRKLTKFADLIIETDNVSDISLKKFTITGMPSSAVTGIKIYDKNLGAYLDTNEYKYWWERDNLILGDLFAPKGDYREYEISGLINTPFDTGNLRVGNVVAEDMVYQFCANVGQILFK